jgi:hypothetical protein
VTWTQPRLAGSFNDRFVGQGIYAYGILEQAEEEQPAPSRAPTVESEAELVEVVVEVLVTDGALVGAEQPALQQGDHQVHPGQQLVGRPLAPQPDPGMLGPRLPRPV